MPDVVSSGNQHNDSQLTQQDDGDGVSAESGASLAECEERQHGPPEEERREEEEEGEQQQQQRSKTAKTLQKSLVAGMFICVFN